MLWYFYILKFNSVKSPVANFLYNPQLPIVYLVKVNTDLTKITQKVSLSYDKNWPK